MQLAAGQGMFRPGCTDLIRPLLASSVLALATACASATTICEAASDHVEACLGERPELAVESCDAEIAKELLGLSCSELATEASGKADGWWCGG
jgi:hypothetical protein